MKRLIIQVASGALMPLTLLPDWLYHLVKYLPFQGILYVPLQCFLGKITGKDAYLVLFQQFIWVIILILIGRMFFKIASRKITIFGGNSHEVYEVILVFFLQKVKSLWQYRVDFW